MCSASAPPRVLLRLPAGVAECLRCLASLQLAVSLLVLLAAVLAGATIVETYLGAPAARWYVYDSPWLAVLLALLAANIAGAALVRIPWQRHQTGFVVTHAGLLLLLGGAAVSAWRSEQGELTLREGERTTELTIPRRSRITAFHVGRPDERPYEFAFAPRPYDWDATSGMPLGAVDGVTVNILEWIHDPTLQTDWVADDERVGGPAVRFKVADAGGRPVAEAWLVDQQFGEPGVIGPLHMQLERAVSAAMLSDFESPPLENLGDQGLLLAYYGDDVLRIPVDGSVGRPLPIGNAGVQVEIVAYLAHARPDRLGQFTSIDDRPGNPMLELRVQLPAAAEPLRQVAFARDPHLNLDGVYGRICPVVFRYLHPAVHAPTDVALMQTADGKLYGRTQTDSQATFLGELEPGDTVAVPGGFRLELVEHLPHARRQISFDPAPHAMRGAMAADAEPAALVEVQLAGVAQRVWMRRNDPVYGQRIVQTSSGALVLQFDHARTPLGFALELVEFVREPNPGNVGNAAFSSRVRLIDEAHDVDREHLISMNQPLTYAGRTFYQANFDDAAEGRESSTFLVAFDPGRPLKYAGGLLVCCGIAIMFYMRAYFFRGVAPAVASPHGPVGSVHARQFHRPEGEAPAEPKWSQRPSDVTALQERPLP